MTLSLRKSRRGFTNEFDGGRPLEMLAEWAFGEIVRYVLALCCGWRGFWRTGGTGDENGPRSCFEQDLWKGDFET